MKGVLLVNLGSPKSPTAKDVKPYLDEFLMDKRVIDVPYLFRAFLVKGIILNTRPKKSAEAYQKIWWEEGSPLIVISERQQKKVQQKSNLPIALAMRYGEPSIQSGLQELHNKGVDEVFMIPLYPQFAMATTETIDVLAEEIRRKYFSNMSIKSFPAFYNRKEYVNALSTSIKNHLDDFDYDHLVFSYHGVPERHIRKADNTGQHKDITIEEGKYCCTPGTTAAEFCYRTHCFETTKQVVEQLGIPKEKYTISFQSRLGPDKWLQPPSDKTINNLAEKGIKKLAVVTPAFVADCLETLEEIGIQAQEDFIKHGGKEFKTVPCLNDDDLWIDALVSWINEWQNS
ncbi:ferrochelatase [Myroides indicus]|uniref:Ferrochelatase n=1 Tax=Myroides indicus TaxID=1323422 RepID=A0A4R7ETZ9_9FLAO|nr:ferrochelatase [Myroides indicus]TDS53992.1 ferrochelatase [Myroides indicus]